MFAMSPLNTNDPVRTELFVRLAEGSITVSGKVEYRSGEIVQAQVDKVIALAKEISLTYSELQDFLELVRLTAFDYRVR